MRYRIRIVACRIAAHELNHRRKFKASKKPLARLNATNPKRPSTRRLGKWGVRSQCHPRSDQLNLRDVVGADDFAQPLFLEGVFPQNFLMVIIEGVAPYHDGHDT